MTRVYERKFDWEEAKRLRAEGRTIGQVAYLLGVSKASIQYATDSRYRERALAKRAMMQRQGVCVDCGTQISSNASRPAQRCRECYALVQASNVRDKELRCPTCGEWKPDDDFPRSSSTGFTHRGRHEQCRACLTIARREYRERNKVPCAGGCGKLVLAPNEQAASARAKGWLATGRCRSCAMALVHERRRNRRATA